MLDLNTDHLDSDMPDVKKGLHPKRKSEEGS